MVDNYGPITKLPVGYQLNQFLLDNLPGIRLQQEFMGQLYYHVPQSIDPMGGEPLLWSQLFAFMENTKRMDFNIEHYSIGQSTLEQVFWRSLRLGPRNCNVCDP